MKRKLPAAIVILIALVLGIVVGYMIFMSYPDKKVAAQIAGYISILSDVFLRLIKMLIGPLVFSTLVVGIAHMGNAASVGRVFAKAISWFIIASLVSLVLGLVLANMLQPGKDLGLPLPDIGSSANLATAKFTLKDFVSHLVPKSFAEAMAHNEILQIVVFSMFFGVALAALGEKGRTLVAAIDELSHVMLVITGYVMKLAPVAVFAAMAATVAVNGLEILLKFAVFMGDFYLGLIVLWGLLILAGFIVLGPRVFRLMVLIKEAFMLSFATASSEAAYPKIIDALDRFGVKRKISSFVMPMGYSFNLDGSMMYCTFAVLFIAQAYDIQLSLGTQITMLLILMLTSKGMAGVPRASLVVIAATLNQFNIPEAGLLLILGIDTFLDMGRSATNAVGNSIATAAVAKWEGELLPPAEAAENERRMDAELAKARAYGGMMLRRLAGSLLAVALASGAPAVLAQADDPAPVQLTGTLAKARASGALTLAFRESSIPFSFLSPRKEPIGYSIELCKKLVEAIGAAVGKELAIQWLAVTSETRIDAITSGRADLECGSTTDNLERRKLVAFSPTIFVAGTKLLVRRGSPVRSFRDLRGRTVAVTAGTTNEKAMHEIARRFKLDFKVVTARDHAESYAHLEAGRADAFATDDVLLFGLVAQHKAHQKYQVVGEFLSYDPYGIMFRKDDLQLAAVVKQAFHDLAEDGEVERQYKRWFLRRLPSGESLDLPMSPQLETLLRAMAVKPE